MTMPNIMRRNGEPKMPMPKASNVPAPSRAPAPSAVTPMPMYDEEVLRVAQRDYDNRRLIVELEAERDDWRRKALSAEAECRRLEMRNDQDARAHDEAIARLTTDRDRKIEEFTQRRDEYGHQLTKLNTKINIQGAQLLELAKRSAKTIDDLANNTIKVVNELADSVSRTVVETIDELKSAPAAAPDVAGTVGLAAIADAIEGDPMPKVVTAGPAPDPDFREVDERHNEKEEARGQR